MALVGSSATASMGTPSTGPRGSRRKQRCWIFIVTGITRDVSEAELLSSVRERYTTVKRLVVRPASTHSTVSSTQDRNVLVEVQFTGPQPSEGPGALLCDLLCGAGVEAKPVELPRGRKKRSRTDAASSEASDSDVEDAGARKMSGHRSTNSLGQVEEEEDETAGGGRVIASKPLFNGHGGSPTYRGMDDDPDTRRSVPGYDSGGAVAASSTLQPLSAADLFKSPVGAPNTSAVTGPFVVVTADARVPPGASPLKHDVLSLEGSGLQQQQPQQENQQFQTSGGAQWDDVVGRMNGPAGSSHSLELGSIDLSSNDSQPPIKSEVEPLLLPSHSLGTWGSNDSQVALLGPMPPPNPVHPPLRGWSFDSSPVVDGGPDFGSGNTVMDLSEMDNMFPSTGGATGSGVSAGSGDSSADAGAGGGQPPQERAPSQWTAEEVLPMEKVVIEPSRKECDFEGHPSFGNNTQPQASSAPGAQCHLVFTGLERTGLDLRTLRVTAHFGVDSLHKVGKVASSIQVGANGHTYAPLLYPSMQEIWPELYSTSNIRVVEVDVVVEIGSDSDEYQYVGPHLKVTYLRSPHSTDNNDQAPRTLGRRPRSFNEAAPNVSYSCVDYSCGDWLAEMCHSMFRPGVNAHQPLHDDQEDLMNVDS